MAVTGRRSFLMLMLGSVAAFSVLGSAESSSGHALPGLDPGASSVRFAVIGDYGRGGQEEATVAAQVKSWAPDIVLTVGDNNYPAGAAETIDANIGQYYHDFIYPYTGGYGLGASANRFYPALGNHDWMTLVDGQPQPYLDYFVLPGLERYYDLVAGPVHFFFIDSDPHESDGIVVGSTQAAWLQGALGASTSRWNVVLMHHAPFSSGPHGSTTALQWPYEAWGADAVLAGHDHDYERLQIGGIPYFVDGAGGSTLYTFSVTPAEGSQVRYNADYGALRIDANSRRIGVQYITRASELIDTFSMGEPVPARCDFDASASTDIGVYRPSTRGWFIKDQLSSIFGLPGDIPVPGDYDGNGTTDVAVYRPSTSAWYVKDQSAAVFGLTGDVPVPGDYNGDGTADIAVYRPSTRAWYVKNQSATIFGLVGDIPVPADYNGDGATDVAVYRPSTRAWYVKNQFSTVFGLADDIPVPADFDGNGAAEIAVYRPFSSGWFVRNQSSTIYGISGDVPIPGDYNADGIADIAVYRPSTSAWYVKNHSATIYGLVGDYPLPAPDTNADGIPYQ